jgi:enoyl-CoA hydratase
LGETTFHHLRLSTDGGIVEVTLARGPVNAVDQEMYRELRDAFRMIGTSMPDARVVVLSGDGKHFCGGNDLHEFRTLTPDNAEERMREVREALWAVYDCPIPVVGAVQGAAVGTGLALVASCDFVVAATGARFGLPELQVGVMGGARHVARLVPQPVVRWMFLSADPMPVEELVRLGALIEVVEPERLREAALARARRIGRHSPAFLRAAKEALNLVEDMELKPGYELEQQYTGRLSGHPDSKEAVLAFLERREPVWAAET